MGDLFFAIALLELLEIALGALEQIMAVAGKRSVLADT